MTFLDVVAGDAGFLDANTFGYYFAPDPRWSDPLLPRPGTVYNPVATLSAGLRRHGMSSEGANGVGRVRVQFQVANNEDLVRAKDGTLPRNKVRRMTIPGIVDPGAAMLVLPEAVAKHLGLPWGDKVKVRYADGRRAPRREAEAAYVELLGRHSTFNAVVEPKRDTALIGAMVLEALDLLVDCRQQRLVPRDPSGPIYEIE